MLLRVYSTGSLTWQCTESILVDFERTRPNEGPILAVLTPEVSNLQLLLPGRDDATAFRQIDL